MKLRNLICRCLAAVLLTSLAWAQSYSRSGASRYMQSRDWQGLKRYAEAWTQASPRDPDGWAYLGLVEGLYLNERAQAVEAIRRSLALNPQQPDGWEALGVNLTAIGQYAQAVEAIQRAIALSPRQLQFRNNLAVAYSQQGNWSAALSTLDEMRPIVVRQNSWQGWYTLGNGYLQMEKAPQAVAAYQQCVRLQPRQGACWTNMGVMLLWGKNSTDALQAYDRGASLGDALGRKNAARLRQAIAQEKLAAQQSANNSNSAENHAYMVMGEQMRRDAILRNNISTP
jgi:superkiller protein 3